MNPLTPAELDRIAVTVNLDHCVGYPAPHDRLHLNTPGLSLEPARTDHQPRVLIVPDGPWHVHDHPNRRAAAPGAADPEIPGPTALNASSERVARWRAQGLTLDQYGRPIHPHWRQLLGDRRIGLPTGAGYFWRYGPNLTVDPIVYRRRGTGAALEILLIRRTDVGRWALPGGYRDPDDPSSEAAARREAAEETGLDRIGGRAETIAHTRSIGPAATLHAWTENEVILIHGAQDYLADTEPVPGDDAADTRWTTLAEITGLDLYDQHRAHITAAIDRIPA